MKNRFIDAQRLIGIVPGLFTNLTEQAGTSLPLLIAENAKSRSISTKYNMAVELKQLRLYQEGMNELEMMNVLVNHHSREIVGNRQNVHDASTNGTYRKIVCVTPYRAPSPTSLVLALDDSANILAHEAKGWLSNEAREVFENELTTGPIIADTTPIITSKGVEIVPNKKIGSFKVLNANLDIVKGSPTPEVATIVTSSEDNIAQLVRIERHQLCLVAEEAKEIYRGFGRSTRVNLTGEVGENEEMFQGVEFTSMIGFREVWEPNTLHMPQLPFVRVRE